MTTIRLYQENPELHPKCLSLFWQISVVITLHQDTTVCNRQRLLQKTTMNQSAELWSPVTVISCTKQIWLLRLREHCLRWKDIVRASRWGSLLWDFLLVMSQATPINSHQHECLDMSWTRETMKDMHANTDVGKPRMPPPYAKNYKKLWKAKRGRNRLPQWKAHFYYSLVSGHPWKHTYR